MKTLDEVNHARQMLREKVQTPGLSELQLVLLTGMLNALVWVADGPAAASGTMERLLAGEPVAPGRDPSEAMQILEKLRTIPALGQCTRCHRPLAHSRLRGMFCPICDRP